MGLDVASAAKLAIERRSPILCVDTCAVLDVLRAPLKPGGARTLAAADDLVVEYQTGRLTLFMAPSARLELERNEDKVKRECEQHLQRVDEAAQYAADCLAQCGAPIKPMSFVGSELAALVDGKYQRLRDACELLEVDREAKELAMDRAVGLLRPSTKGSVSDANIIEHYFALGRELKRQGFDSRFVFVSSNTADYCEQKRTLHPDLSRDFVDLSLTFTSTLEWAKHALGL
jgi:hypothetical protein